MKRMGLSKECALVGERLKSLGGNIILVLGWYFSLPHQSIVLTSGCDRWLTLGNQLGPDQIYEEDLAARIKAKYGDLFSWPEIVLLSNRQVSGSSCQYCECLNIDL